MTQHNYKDRSFFLLKSSAFTLIELLVVVLIIGILAAIALPQYTKAVQKARYAEALSTLRTYAQAFEVSYLQNGTYPENWEELDVTHPGTIDASVPNHALTKHFKYRIYPAAGMKNIEVSSLDSSNDVLLIYIAQHVTEATVTRYSGKILCTASQTDNKANALCLSLGGKTKDVYGSGAQNRYAYTL
ncbi:type IV pilus assembly protein PilE [Elusimicrobium posterum]|uniref:type IV pilin protein n=1 Tax=Elusimicrobium posterum TaxID=3116653 RepID=UPI003C7782D9